MHADAAHEADGLLDPAAGGDADAWGTLLAGHPERLPGLRGAGDKSYA